MQIEVAGRFHGPPAMGHGGYVAGLLAARTPGAVRVTLRRPTPLDTPLELVDEGDHRYELRHGDDVLAVSEPTSFSLDVPPAPTLEAARAAEELSPSRHDGRGVHGQCFGCGDHRPDGDGLRVFAGPVEVEGRAMVAGTWRPDATMARSDGTVDPHFVLAALDCPGAFAFIAGEARAGLLGRIEFQQHADVPADDELVVTGWQVGREGRKLFAGTAVSGSDGAVLAIALATWFPFEPRG